MKQIILILVGLGVLFLWWKVAHAEKPKPVVEVLQVIEVVEPDTDALFEKIALCESGNDPLAKNPNSTASGRMQFLKSSWEHYGKEKWEDDWVNKNVFDYDQNTELGIYVYEKYGVSPWLASRECWE